MSGGFLPTSGPSLPRLPSRPSTIPTSQLMPLSERQQSIMIRHFDVEMDKLIGGMKARLDASQFTRLDYAVHFATRLINLLLAIPPFDTSASIRTAYMLRLTGEFTSGLEQYDLASSEAKSATFGLYDLLDRGWLCCLQARVWDRALGRGVTRSEILETEGVEVSTIGDVSMTERSRLLSLALRCRESIASQTHASPLLDTGADDTSGPESEDEDMQTENGITQAGSVVGATSLALGGLFGRTLAFLDSSSGS